MLADCCSTIGGAGHYRNAWSSSYSYLLQLACSTITARNVNCDYAMAPIGYLIMFLANYDQYLSSLSKIEM